MLVEKPLAASTEGLRDVWRLISSGAARVYVACDLRFDRALLYFRDRLPEIGSVHSVRIACQSYLPDWRPARDYRQSYSARENEGGVLLDLIHEIDYAVWLFGSPSQVFARLSNSGRLGIDSEEAADIYWETSGGTAVSIRLDYLTRSTHRSMCAYGDAGEVTWDGVSQNVSLRLCNGELERRAFPQQRDEALQEEDEAFLRAVSGGNPGTLATFEEGAVTLAVCELLAVRRGVAGLRRWRTGEQIESTPGAGGYSGERRIERTTRQECSSLCRYPADRTFDTNGRHVSGDRSLHHLDRQRKDRGHFPPIRGRRLVSASLGAGAGRHSHVACPATCIT